jgi:predicted ArsR family transcriptional regulator
MVNVMEPVIDQLPLGQRSPAVEILRLIQRNGPQNIKSIETSLGVSENAVREQLQHLIAAGLITTAKVRRGAGRPAHVYSLSEKAHSLFPQAYDVLLKLLIEEIVNLDGATRVQELLKAVGERLADDVTGGVHSGDLREQLRKVSAALDERKMPIAVLEQEDVLSLHEWSCPYYSLAREHQGICEMEQHMLERALDAQVTIAERMVDGHAGCRFIVRQKDRQATH